MGSILQKFFALPGLILLLLCTQKMLVAQEINEEMISRIDTRFKKAIGLDENLINGYVYINEYTKMQGHVFFGNDEFVSGSLVLNHKKYSHVPIKYDILNQNIILSYTTSLQGTNQIVLRSNLITEFDMDDRHFEKLSFPETGAEFFQVIYRNRITCLYFWNKTIIINPSSVHNYYECSEQSKKTYLLMDNTLREYTGNRSFIKLFPNELREPLKKYIRSHRIRMKNASEKSMVQLMRFCESLIS